VPWWDEKAGLGSYNWLLRLLGGIAMRCVNLSIIEEKTVLEK